jgi:hypothetical protein
MAVLVKFLTNSLSRAFSSRRASSEIFERLPGSFSLCPAGKTPADSTKRFASFCKSGGSQQYAAPIAMHTRLQTAPNSNVAILPEKGMLYSLSISH